MERLRHIAPMIAVLLSVIILAETTDLVGCPDETIGTSRAHTPAALSPDATPLLTNIGGVTLHQHDTSDGPAQERRAAPDCLCQITFVSTLVLPYLGAPVELPVDYPTSEASMTEGEGLVPSPVPLT